MPNPSTDRPKNRQTEDENLKPQEPGPPRPATEPKGAERSSQSPKLSTDPGSGQARPPSPKAKAPPGWP